MAYCGLTCNSCPIYLATLEEDTYQQHSMREKIAEQCSTYYDMNLQAEDISDCDGCRAGTGRLFSGCTLCEIRKCAIRKNTESCAFCSEYACAILKRHFSLDPGAEIRLEQIRKTKK
jgi:hypothetical protein